MIPPPFQFGPALASAAAIVLCAAPFAEASGASDRAFSLGLAGSMALGATQQAPEDLASDHAGSLETPDSVPVFGSRGSSWWSVSTSAMFDDDENRDYSIRFGYHNFLAEDFEINLALTGWLHDQPNDDEVSGSFDLGFRYHFINNRQRGWSVYADMGIGIMFSSGEVPEGGTEYNFTPRIGFGVTMRLPEQIGGSAGGRLDLSAGWQHYSNASTAGSDNNPARDSLFVRAGVVFPF